jgi:hypothetical protein
VRIAALFVRPGAPWADAVSRRSVRSGGRDLFFGSLLSQDAGGARGEEVVPRRVPTDHGLGHLNPLREVHPAGVGERLHDVVSFGVNIGVDVMDRHGEDPTDTHARII